MSQSTDKFHCGKIHFTKLDLRFPSVKFIFVLWKVFTFYDFFFFYDLRNLFFALKKKIFFEKFSSVRFTFVLQYVLLF